MEGLLMKNEESIAIITIIWRGINCDHYNYLERQNKRRSFVSVQRSKHGTNNDTVDTPELHAVGSTEYGSQCRSQSVAKYHSRVARRR